jgi:hypothetical protein
MANEPDTEISNIYYNPFRTRRLTFEQNIVHTASTPTLTAAAAVAEQQVTTANRLNVYSATEVNPEHNSNMTAVDAPPYPDEYIGEKSHIKY